MVDALAEPALHQAAGRLLATIVDRSEPIADDELARSAGLSLASAETVLDWLRELNLVAPAAPQQHTLAAGRFREQRSRFQLLLHLEPDAGLSSFCHSLLGEQGFPTIGVESAAIAARLLEGVEFDLALLSSPGRAAAAFLTSEADLLRRLPPAPIIVYGSSEDEERVLVGTVAAILPGPLHPETLLATVQTLLPARRPPPASAVSNSVEQGDRS